MTAARCYFCERSFERGHHATGRCGDAKSPYLDLELVTPLCHDDHELVADDWHTIGAPELREAPISNPLERVLVRLLRIAAFFGRWHEARPGDGFRRKLAEAFALWAAELMAVVTVLDHHVPGWRSWFD
jgi:hypothetical protein